MKNRIFLTLVSAIFINQSFYVATSYAANYATNTPQQAVTPKLIILEPKNGATVTPTFTVKFGASGVNIVPVGGEHANHDHSGHHKYDMQSGHFHLLTDAESLPSPDHPMPANANITHLTQGQTEAQLTLTPGKHTLQLVLGDSSHMTGAAPIVSKKITVIVK